MRTTTNVCRLVGRRVTIETAEAAYAGTLLLAGPNGVELGDKHGVRHFATGEIRSVSAV